MYLEGFKSFGVRDEEQNSEIQVSESISYNETLSKESML